MRILRVLLFASGMAGLVYEVVWTRLLTMVVGSTALAMTSVFSVFLASLALGAWLFGRLGLSGDRALRAYGLLELLVAVAAVLTSVVLILGEVWLGGLGPPAGGLGPTLAFGVGVSAVLLGPPVALMGATLPAAVGAVAGRGSPRREVTRLYGWNTLGAATGALAAGFVLIRVLGIPGALAVAVALNGAASLGALLLARAGSGHGVDSRPQAGVLPRGNAERTGGPATSGAPAAVGELRFGVLWLFLAFVSGFVVLGYEILWGRLGHFLLGDRTMALSALLFVVVGSLGLGSILAGRLPVRRVGSGGAVAVGRLLLAGGVLHLVAAPLAVAVAAGTVLPGLVSVGFAPRLVVFGALAGPPMVVLGAVFPLLMARSRGMDRRPGRTVGELYLVNTVGAVVGAAVATWALSRVFGTPGSFLAMSALLIVVGSGVVVFSGKVERVVLPLAATSALVLAGLVFPRALVRVRPDERLVALAEDEYGVQTLTRTDRGHLRVRNNRLSLVFDLGHPQTDHAQQMPAHLAVLLAGDADRVLNIGTGYGITAGTFTLYDVVESIVTVEILPFLVERQRQFRTHNFRYVDDPRVDLVQGDGRHVMLAADRSWDVISVNVLDPYLPGSSALYTVDFWERARDRLRPGGVYTQLFWGDDVPLLVKGLRRVFPTVLYFPAYGGTSWNVMAFRDAVTPEALTLRLDRLTPAARAALAAVGEPASGLVGGVEAAWSARRTMNRLADGEPGPVHTDLRPVLEYRWSSAEGVSMTDSPLIQY